MSFLSIIIPVYNAERYLRECVASVQAQTWRDWEILLIDDGSSDGSAALCDDLASEDERIRVVHQENQGTSAARNTGLAAVRGEYVTFMDNDDWWDGNDALEELVRSIQTRPVDFVWYMNAAGSADGSTITHQERTDYADVVARMEVGEAIRFIIGQGMTSSAVWNKVVRRKLIEDHNILFPIGQRNEDTAWSAKVIARCQSIAWFDRRFYVYREGHEYAQTSKRLPESSVRDLEGILRENVALAATLPPSRARALMAFLAFPMVVWVSQAHALGIAPYQKGSPAWQLERSFVEVTSWSGERRIRAITAFARVAGMRVTGRVLGTMFRRQHPSAV